MKILLLGANGQLGSDIVRVNATQAKPLNMTAWTRRDIDIGDISNIKNKLLAQSFDVLINCTSYHNTEQVEANPAQAFAINAFAVREMAQACREKNATFIHISTDYVFGGAPVKRPLTEMDAPSPLNIYGASKLMGEALANATHANVVILRVASLFGVAGASGKGGNFIETILKHAKEKGKLRVVSDQHMSPTSTLDVARMILTLIQKGVTSGIYHAVNTGSATWYELALKAVQLCGVNATVEAIPASEYPLKAMRPPYSVLDNHKIAAEIGAVPGWEAALKEYLEEKKHVTNRASL